MPKAALQSFSLQLYACVLNAQPTNYHVGHTSTTVDEQEEAYPVRWQRALIMTSNLNSLKPYGTGCVRIRGHGNFLAAVVNLLVTRAQNRET